ncbi:MAG: type I-C CRISPR-associated endonuclease Cas1c [Clostridiales bacterium]|jgi:CRISPR-associated protein Cas1|nr:type I-C CRISPR-associated endonuclease Cas1c [Clostridiales bacterium]
MKKILNSLYILNPDTMIGLDGENIVVQRDDEVVGRVRLHEIESINYFGYRAVSPALMESCIKHGVSLNFFRPSGRFMARATGLQNGNVLLRRQQYRVADSATDSLKIAKNFIIGKIYNARWVIERTIRDHAMRVDAEALKAKSTYLKNSLSLVANAKSDAQLRGLEGEAASVYFSVFNTMILQQKDDFKFDSRNKRPPLDNVNALLSLTYTMLAHMCEAGLEGAGLDSYVGFFHKDRSGRKSLALDLMEEMRTCFADRFVLYLINKRIICNDHFLKKENGSVILTDEGRKVFFTKWEERKHETLTHPFTNEKIEWGIVPHIQSMLLARYLRGDIDEYPPFFWK